MSWEKKKFGNFITLQRGYDLTREQFTGGEYPVVSSTTIMGYHNEYKATAPGVVIGRSGTLGEVQYISTDYWPHNTCLYVRDYKKNYPKFVYYYLKFFGTEQSGGGSAVPTLNRNNLNVLDVNIPSIEIQNRIADILSAYDDLIENNQKQIKLLEEAAQRLYKEWFVDLHFPGHESTPITDGIPQGWKKEKIDDVYDIKYGKTLPTTKISGNGEYPVYGANGVIGYYNQCNYIDYVTLITSRGNGSGDVSRTHHKKAFITNNSFIVNPKESFQHCKLPFTYLLFLDLDFRAIRTGSAQPQLTNTSISTLNLLMPSKEIVLNFIEKTSAIFEKIEVLYQSISNAIEARDRLLPKLMNGEIEVAVNKQETVMVDKFENIRKHWQNVPYDEDLPLAARSTGDISEETLEKLKEIAEEE